MHYGGVLVTRISSLTRFFFSFLVGAYVASCLRKTLNLCSGNPGLANFYVPLLSTIYARHTPSNLAIIAHGLLDHFPGVENQPGRYSAEDSLTIQVETSLEVLDAIVSYYSKKASLI